jgi:arylsulfatase A-like enzyme
VLGACQRVVTHEPGSGYDSTAVTGNASYEPSTNGPQPYQGAAKARARFGGRSDPVTTHAYGEIGAGNLDDAGTYGAALYFPPGTFTGAAPRQTGAVDVMRWHDGANRGGVRIGPDHRARLVTASGADVEPNKRFIVREGCWNWVVVHQDISTSDAASSAPLNEVFVNGERVISSTKRNATSQLDRGVDGVQFGLVAMDAAQTEALTFYVDDPFVSSDSEPRPPAVGASLCKPLPNVLFIVTDDQRAGTIDDLDPTTDSPNDPDRNPANDYWMRKTRKWFHMGSPGTTGGTEFSHAVATTPNCCPSRSSIFTGLYAHNHGVETNLDAGKVDPQSMLQVQLRDPNRVPVPYRTGIFGKYLNGWDLNQAPPSFDRWAIYHNGVHSPTSEAGSCRHPAEPPGPIVTSRGLNCINEQGTLRGYPYAPAPYPQYETGYLRDQVLGFIDESEAKDEQPWFMYVAPTIPHIPLTPEPGKYDAPNGPLPPPFPVPEPLDFLESDLTGKPPYVRASRTSDRDAKKAQTATQRDNQLRMLRSVDDLVGAIFTRLREQGEDRNTLAVFVSDNAYLWGEHWLAKKPFPYREDIDVPLFVRWPGHAPDHGADRRPAANLDLAPTVMSAAGLTPAAPMDGRDLLAPSPTRNRWLTESWHETDPPAATDAPDWAALTTPPPAPGDSTTPYYHYIEYYDDFGAITFREYYDLRADPFELDNLYGSDGDPDNDPPTDPSATTLSARLAADRACSGTACP